MRWTNIRELPYEIRRFGDHPIWYIWADVPPMFGYTVLYPTFRSEQAAHTAAEAGRRPERTWSNRWNR